MDEQGNKTKNVTAAETETPQLVGFDRDLEPEKILGTADVNGQIVYLVQWKGTDDADLVISDEVKERGPQVANASFEKRIDGNPGSEAESSDTKSEIARKIELDAEPETQAEIERKIEPKSVPDTEPEGIK